MEQVPYIDEHFTVINAPSGRVWKALASVLRDDLGVGGGAPIARLLRCEPAKRSAEFDARPGQTLPGFRVAGAERGRRLTLEGSHRFSRYRLTFILDGDRLVARTHAAFPGLRGRLYRTAVIGTGGHRIVTRRLLRQVASRA